MTRKNIQSSMKKPWTELIFIDTCHSIRLAVVESVLSLTSKHSTNVENVPVGIPNASMLSDALPLVSLKVRKKFKLSGL